MFLKNKIQLILLYILIILLLLINPSYCSSITVWSNESKNLNSTNNTIQTSTSNADLNLDCGGAILIEQHSR